jgi:S-formylglutathione hydrolase FrmB
MGTMQYDVKSTHGTTSGVLVNYRTRLKGAIISANSSAAARNTIFANNVTQSGTYNIPNSTTCTVTITNHGLTTGDRVWLNFTSGSAVDNVYTVTVTGPNAFEVTTGSLTTSGNVTMYADILLEADSYNATAFNVVIPGEGILAQDGIFVGLVTNITATIFFG